MRPRIGWWVALLAGFLTVSSPALVGALTVDDVIELLQAGVGEEVILRQMEADGSVFHLDARDILDLRYAGASDDLIEAMIATAESEPRRRTYHDWDDAYRVTYVAVYYDPFGYYWYPWPFYFSYWAPFVWFDFGFYWGGAVWWDWTWWGPRWRYYAYDCGYYVYPRYRPGRPLWGRTTGVRRTSYIVSPKTPRRSERPRGLRAAKEPRRPGWSRGAKPPRSARGREALSRKPHRREGREGQRSRSWSRSPRRENPKTPARSGRSWSRSGSRHQSEGRSRGYSKPRAPRSGSRSSAWSRSRAPRAPSPRRGRR
jgi:hypothetical protein